MRAVNTVHCPLQFKSDSMLPRIKDGDIVIIQKYFMLHDNDVVIIFINGDVATCKQVIKQENYLRVQAFNPFFTNDQINSLPISCKIVEFRAKV